VTPRRGATGLLGVLPVDKPAGMTSHDVVNVVRRVTGERRIGHAGTLDPMATGLLVVLVGPATRLAPYLTGAAKTYETLIAFGSETDTDDADGVVTRTAPVPAELAGEARASAVLTTLLGEQDQVPPAFSAVKVAGRTAYDVARRGGNLELTPRRIEVLEAELLGVQLREPLTLKVRFTVSKGTYIRALARDLGRSLGTAAHLVGLRRTRSGALTLADASSLSEVEACGPERIAQRFVDPVAALGLPALEVTAEIALRVANGAALEPRDIQADLDDGPLSLTRDSRLVAVYEKRGSRLSAAVVFPGSVTSS